MEIEENSTRVIKTKTFTDFVPDGTGRVFLHIQVVTDEVFEGFPDQTGLLWFLGPRIKYSVEYNIIVTVVVEKTSQEQIETGRRWKAVERYECNHPMLSNLQQGLRYVIYWLWEYAPNIDFDDARRKLNAMYEAIKLSEG